MGTEKDTLNTNDNRVQDTLNFKSKIFEMTSTDLDAVETGFINIVLYKANKGITDRT